MKDLNHTNIPKIYDMYEDEEYLYIVEEYISGEQFDSYCKNNVLHEPEVIDFAIQICDIIEYLHSQNPPVLYLDLKPENLIYTDKGLYLTDFGSCVKKEGASAGCRYGTIGYAAPEQMFKGTADERADIYAIGMMIVFMGSNASKELSPDNKSFIMNTGRRLRKLTKQCLKKQSVFRIQRVSELKHRLKALYDGSFKNDSGNTKFIKIAVTGAHAGAGTTYVSFMLGRYFKSRGRRAVVVQTSENGLVQAAVQRRIVPEDGIFRLYGISAAYCSDSAEETLTGLGFDAVIADIGVQGDVLEVFDEAPDYIIAVCTAAEWQAERLDECIKRYKGIIKANILLAFNFAGNDEYYKRISRIEGLTVLRLPVCIDTCRKNDEQMAAVFDDIFGSAGGKRGIFCVSLKGKIQNMLKRHL